MGSVDTAMMGFVTSAAKSYVKGRRAKQKMRTSSSPRHTRRSNEDDQPRQRTISSSSLRDKAYPSTTTITTSTSATGLGGHVSCDMKGSSTTNSPALIFRHTKSPLHNHHKSSTTAFGQSPLRDGPTPRFPIPSLSALTPDKSFMSQTGSSQHSGTGFTHMKGQQGSPSGTSSGSPRTAPSHGSLLLTPSTTTTSNHPPGRDNYNTPAAERKDLRTSAPSTAVAHLVRPVPPPAKQSATKAEHTRSPSLPRAKPLSRETGGVPGPSSAAILRAKSSSPNDFTMLSNNSTINVSPSSTIIPAPSPETSKGTHHTHAHGHAHHPQNHTHTQPHHPLAASPLAVYSTVVDSNTWRHSSSMPASLNAPSLPPQTTPRIGTPFVHKVSSGGILHEPLPMVREGPTTTSIIHETSHLPKTATMSLPSHVVQRETPPAPQLIRSNDKQQTILHGPPQVGVDRPYGLVGGSSLPPSQVSPTTTMMMHRQLSSPMMMLQPPRHFTSTQNPYEPLEQAIPVLQHHISSPVDVVYEAQMRNQQMHPHPRPLHSGGGGLRGGDMGSSPHSMVSAAAAQGATASDDEVSLRDLVLRYQPPVERGDFEGLPDIPKIVGRNKKPMKLPRNLELDSFSGYIVPSESAKFGIKARRNNPFCVQC